MTIQISQPVKTAQLTHQDFFCLQTLMKNGKHMDGPNVHRFGKYFAKWKGRFCAHLYM